MGKYERFKGIIPTHKEALQDLKDTYSTNKDVELLELFSMFKEHKKVEEAILKDIDQNLAALTEVLVDHMEAKNLSQLTSTKHGAFSIRTRVFVQQQDKEKLMRWLQDNQYGDLIKPAVSPQSLNALFTEILSNSSLPEDAGVTVFLKSTINNTPHTP